VTTEELKAHRRAICEALIEGKQCQLYNCGQWLDRPADVVCTSLWIDSWKPEHIRIKPEPRKVWVGWRGPECFPILAETEESFRYMSNKYPHFNWQLVEEPE
jgi:hypothetical protein